MNLKNNTRRSFLRAVGGAVGIAALSGCTATTSGNVTTVTLNTAEVMDYGDSILSFAKAGIVLPFVSTAIGASGLVIAEAAITALETALSAFNTAAGGKATVSYDDTSAKTAFDSIVAAIEKIDTYIVATITATVSDTTVVTEAKSAANAASGLISIIRGLVDSLSVGKHVGASMRGDVYVSEIAAWQKTQTH